MSTSGTQGHGREQVLQGENDAHLGQNGSSKSVVERKATAPPPLRQKGNPLQELERLSFTPKVTAGAHIRRFERLVATAYPGVSSAGK